MPDGQASGGVPSVLEEMVRARDAAPLPDGALVRFQHIGLAPGIAKNFRFVLYEDGRLFSAVNTPDPPADDQQQFNVALPDQPSAAVPAESVDQVRDLLVSSAFAASPSFVGTEGVRDGSLVIVTARVDGDEHEVWFANTDTDLTDYLWALHDEVTQEPLDLDVLLADLTGQHGEDEG